MNYKIKGSINAEPIYDYSPFSLKYMINIPKLIQNINIFVSKLN
jgi:hypothetical protein